MGQSLVREAHGFQLAHIHSVIGQALLANGVFHLHQFLNLPEKPGLIFTAFINLRNRCAVAEGLCDFEQAIWSGQTECGADGILVIAFTDTGNGDFIHTGKTGFKAAQSFLE